MEVDIITCKGTLYCHADGIRIRGRQAKKWINDLKDEMKRIQFSTKEAVKATRDRTTQRHGKTFY